MDSGESSVGTALTGLPSQRRFIATNGVGATSGLSVQLILGWHLTVALRTHVLVVPLSNSQGVQEDLVGNVLFADEFLKLLRWSGQEGFGVDVSLLVFSLSLNKVATKEVVDLLLIDEVALEVSWSGVGLLWNENLHEPSLLHHLVEASHLLLWRSLLLLLGS